MLQNGLFNFKILFLTDYHSERWNVKFLFMFIDMSSNIYNFGLKLKQYFIDSEYL
jgi:hypothetical protein